MELTSIFISFTKNMLILSLLLDVQNPFPFSRFLPEEMHSFLYQQAHEPPLFSFVDREGTIDVYSDLEDLKPLSASEVLRSFPEWRDASSRLDDVDINAPLAADNNSS